MDFTAVASGFCFLEAPRADRDGSVWFTDVVLGGLRRLLPDGRVDEWLAGRRWIGGIVLNSDGAVLCSGGDGIAWLDPASGASGMLLRAIDGKPVRGVNELLPDGSGGLFFGTADVAEAEHGGERGPSELFRLAADGKVRQLCGGLTFSNGIGLSPDGRRLYFNDTFVGTYACDLLPDGGLGKRVLLAEQRDCDGLAVDREGGIWIAGFQSGAITRLLPDGRVDRRVPLPVAGVTSLCFGGADLRDLYVTTAAPDAFEALAKRRLPSAAASLYRARSDVAGLPVGRTAFRLSGA
jgi:sugar lactone lactonase YvrE